MSQQDEDKEVYEKLKVLLEEALERDKVLREKFKAGDKFDIVPKKLQNILAEVEENLKKIAGLALSSKARRPDVLAADETVVYVYLFVYTYSYPCESQPYGFALCGFGVSRCDF